MQAEHLRQWLIAVTWYDLPDTINWNNVVAIMQASFCEGTMAKECTWQTVVLIQKGKRDLRRIGLGKVL